MASFSFVRFLPFFIWSSWSYNNACFPPNEYRVCCYLFFYWFEIKQQQKKNNNSRKEKTGREKKYNNDLDMKYLLICFTFCSRLFRTSHHKLPSLPGLLISMVFNMQPMKHDGKGRPLLIIVKSVRRDHLPNSFKRKTKRETQERERDEKGVLSTLRYRDNSNSSVTQTRSYYLVSITITTTESLPPSGGWNEEEDSESTSVWNVRVEFHRQFEAEENVSVRALLVNIVREQKPREKKTTTTTRARHSRHKTPPAERW